MSFNNKNAIKQIKKWNQLNKQGGDLPDTLSHYLEEFTLEKDTIIFKATQLPEYIYFITEGKVGIYHESDVLKKHYLSMLNPGDILGEIGAVSGSPRTASACVISQVKGFQIKRAILMYLMEIQHPATELLLMNITKHIAKKIYFEIQSVIKNNTVIKSDQIKALYFANSDTQFLHKIKNTPVLNHFSHEELKGIINSAQVVSISRNTFFHLPPESSYVYFVIEGAFEAILKLENHDLHLLFHNGNVVGLVDLLISPIDLFSYKTREDTLIARFDIKSFNSLNLITFFISQLEQLLKQSNRRINVLEDKMIL